MSGIRRVLIEIWVMVALSALFGFLGPFGTYLDGDFVERSLHWGIQMLGAYVLVRPSILLWQAIANATALPRGTLLFWGVLLSSLPLTLLWTWSSRTLFHGLNGFAEMLPFAILCALAVLAITGWAKTLDARLTGAVEADADAGGLQHTPVARPLHPSPADTDSEARAAEQTPTQAPAAPTVTPRLALRLSVGFKGPITALESEDHYVRVHGTAGSELILIRLRDAVAEMDGISGEQVHRSWWIARGGISAVEVDGRKRILHLPNGAQAQVARDSIARLEKSGFLADRFN